MNSFVVFRVRLSLTIKRPWESAHARVQLSTKEKLSVAKWIESPDYEFVCDMAELNASKLKIHLKKIATSKPMVSRYLGERLKKTIQNRSLFN